MGGGDLNAKKAWHPNTMKNQERVWKAEQAAAEEKKRILELQRERALERDREELNKLAKGNSTSLNTVSENQLHWMYDKPDKKVQHEDYLLGKAIDKNYEQGGKSEQNEIPAVSRRVVGSSMLGAGSEVQVDLARKLREDPLLLVKERERAARAALLNNPVQRSKLTELLRKEQELKNAKSKKKLKKQDKDLDNMLAAKLHALGSGKGVDLAKLLAADDSSDESSTKEKKRKKKKSKEKKKSKKDKYDCDSETKDKLKKMKKKYREDDSDKKSSTSKIENTYYNTEKRSSSKKRKTSNSDTDIDTPNSKKKTLSDQKNEVENIHRKRRYDERRQSSEYKEKQSSKHVSSKVTVHQHTNKHKKGLSEEEKAAKLAEMAAAGAEREIQRGRRVAKQLSDIAADEQTVRLPRSSNYNEARALPDSLEGRIHSNRHYIQRDRHHMNEHFARR